ncbi:MAG: hypothetical protein LLF76_14470 [Planctomycetaceae bacterium]|nr:hypothetical protein [Planctomycetaceae bacterium]
MKCLAVLAAGMMIALAGCRCGCENDGINDGGYSLVPDYNADMVRQSSPMEPVNVYAYQPPEMPVEAIAAIAITEAPAVEVMTQNDGIVAGDGVQLTPFDKAYDELMGAMDLEDIGTGSTYRLIR